MKCSDSNKEKKHRNLEQGEVTSKDSGLAQMQDWSF